MKKTIIHLVNSNIFSGLEKVSCEIINNLKNEYNFIYITRDGPIVEFLKKYKINYFIIKRMSVKELERIVNLLKPDLIHAHDYRASCIASFLKIDIPIISHLHNNSPWLKIVHPYSVLYLISSRKFKKILIVSESIKKEYIFSKYIKDKYVSISNPLDRNSILQKINKNYEKEYDICCVGRLTKQKNPKKFIKIIYKLKKEYPNIKAIWIGDGELFNKCCLLIKKYQLTSNIKLLGYIENPYKYMKKSKIFLLTSDWEGYGLVVFEALTLGLPCVTSNVGGLPNLIDETSGFLCKKEKDYLDNIKYLLNNKKYLSFSKNANLKSIKLENKNKYINNIKKIYNDILL